MSKETESLREKVGNFAIGGGIIAGLIGLFTNPSLLIGGALVAGGGYALRKTA